MWWGVVKRRTRQRVCQVKQSESYHYPDSQTVGLEEALVISSNFTVCRGRKYDMRCSQTRNRVSGLHPSTQLLKSSIKSSPVCLYAYLKNKMHYSRLTYICCIVWFRTQRCSSYKKDLGVRLTRVLESATTLSDWRT